MTHQNITRGGRVVVALSGGVDSAVAALLLRDAGFRVSGVFMENWRKTKLTPHCTVEEDRRDALRVAHHLNIPFRTMNFEREYEARVIKTFFREYEAGRTPNPDILCNKEIKFKAFLDAVHRLGIDRIATGHYARVERHGAQYRLLRGLDGTKDQSYFLYALGQSQLQKTLMPIGGMKKRDVRILAKKSRLPVADKPDSQGICFVGKIDLLQLLRSRISSVPGPIIDSTGQKVGEHQGLAFYTIGQRQGLGVGGGMPLYVAAKDALNNTLIVARGNSDPILYHQQLLASEALWVSGVGPAYPLHCQAVIRYRQQPQTVVVTELPDASSLNVAFDEPQRAVTPGQSIVFYDGEACLGGAIIDQAV